MYPDFQYLLQALLGMEMPAWLSLFKTFGLLVALSFVCAALATAEELKRKEKIKCLLTPEIITVETGKFPTVSELIISLLIGFVIGYKFGGVFGHFADVSPDPMGYLLSLNGSIWGGLAGGILPGGSKYFEKKKQELPEVKVTSR